jgi:hypothetical protein
MNRWQFGSWHLASIEEIQDKIEFVLCLKTVMQRDQEWMVDVVQEDIPLRHHVLHLIPTFDVLLLGILFIFKNIDATHFAQHFHCIHFAVPMIADHVDTAK